MATASKEFQYRPQGVVMGSAAHDLTWEDPEHQLRHAGQRPSFTVEHTPGTKVREKVQPKVQTVVEVCQAHPVSAVAVIGFVAVIALAVMTVWSFVQLTMLSAQVVDLGNELTALQSQSETLQSEYDQLFDLSTVQAVATANGMTKPVTSQVYYMDLSSGDQAVVCLTEDLQPSAWEQTTTAASAQVSRMVEYFR